ncbi:MAG: DUF1573 domain-containing protein [Candidatus Melainabacteria bacterium]|nr:DUF1573 domain-containing protein [Candidatus Melainabacteria bacterium]
MVSKAPKHQLKLTERFQLTGRRVTRIGSLVAILLVVAPLTLTSCSNIQNPFEKKPRLDFQPDVVELGLVEEGAEVPTSFMLKNVGSEVLKIHEAHSTCGCTVPNLKEHDLKPGESTKLDIMVDTTMKQGAVTKTVEVSSNDPDMPVVSLPIKMEVKNRHEGLTDDGRVKIFTDQKCASCHVDKGVGLGGKDLFEADCAMCHGDDAKGAVGGALIFGNYDDPKYAKHIRDVIENGSKTHRSMPGFLDRAGGPLIKEQVDSLIVYLQGLSEKEKKNKAQGTVKTEASPSAKKSEQTEH